MASHILSPTRTPDHGSSSVLSSHHSFCPWSQATSHVFAVVCILVSCLSNECEVLSSSHMFGFELPFCMCTRTRRRYFSKWIYETLREPSSMCRCFGFFHCCWLLPSTTSCYMLVTADSFNNLLKALHRQQAHFISLSPSLSLLLDSA